MKKKTTLRDIINLIHRRTGLAIALFLCIVGITGTILAFGRQIDHILNPGLHAARQLGKSPLPLAVFAQNAEAAYPHLRSTGLASTLNSKFGL